MSKKKLLMIFLVLWFVPHSSLWAIAKKPPSPKDNPQNVEPMTYSLLDCYKLAIKRSETLAISKESVEATEAEFFQATSEIFGDVDFVMTDFRQQKLSSTGGSDGVGGTLTRDHRRERKFVITQPLFQGFKSMAALGAAGSLRKQRTKEWQRAQELLFSDVSDAFYNLLRYKNEVQILRETSDSLEERLRELYEREKIGRSRSSEGASALSKKKIIESELARSEGALAISHHILEFLIGLPTENIILKDENLPSDSDFRVIDYADFSEMRPDVEAAHYATKTAWSGVIDAQSGYWPTMSFDGNVYEKREGFQKDIDWDVLFTIRVPLSRGGENFANLKRAFSSWKKAKLNESLTKRQADLDIQSTYANWETSVKESAALDEAVAASRANFDLQKDDYSHNLVSNLDVLEALEELNNTRRQANQSYYAMKENYWKLQIATGRLYEYL